VTIAIDFSRSLSLTRFLLSFLSSRSPHFPLSLSLSLPKRRLHPRSHYMYVWNNAIHVRHDPCIHDTTHLYLTRLTHTWPDSPTSATTKFTCAFHKKDPYLRKKVPLYSQKSPIHPQKNPIYPQKSPSHPPPTIVENIRSYGVASMSRTLKIIGLFCKRALQKRPIFCKETYMFKRSIDRSHPIPFFVSTIGDRWTQLYAITTRERKPTGTKPTKRELYMYIYI